MPDGKSLYYQHIVVYGAENAVIANAIAPLSARIVGQVMLTDKTASKDLRICLRFSW